MEGERSKKRARRAAVDEGEASTQQQAASAAGDAGELSALERLHPDVLSEVLQQLGFAEASRVRAVSKAMKNAVDNAIGSVAWRSLRLKVTSVEQLKRAAASFIRPQQPENGQGACTRRVKLAKGCKFEVLFECELGGEQEALRSLFSACSASSGGLGGVFIEADMRLTSITRIMPTHVVAAILDPLYASEAEGGSFQTLKSISISIFGYAYVGHTDVPDGLVQILSRFTRLERLYLPGFYALDAAATSVLSSELPALRSAVVTFSDGAALAPFASHPALEELHIYIMSDSSSGFRAFAAGPAARRLRKLRVRFSHVEGFIFAEFPSLARFTSLETLDVAVYDVLTVKLTYAGLNAYERALAGLTKLRELRLLYPTESNSNGIASLRDLTRAVAALRAHSLVTLRLEMRGDGLDRYGLAEVALGELLRAAGPALVDLIGTGTDLLRSHVAAALPACSRLRRLQLYKSYRAITGVVDVLAACPSLEQISGFIIPCSDEREVAKSIEALRRLAAACRLGDGSGCNFYILQHGHAYMHAERLAEEGISAILPKARVR